MNQIIGQQASHPNLLPRIIVVGFVFISLAAMVRAAEWTDLLGNDLSQWETYLSFRHQDGYKGAEPVDAAGNKIEPIGYNNDPAGGFTVIEDQGRSVLRVSGEIYGCIFTKQEFANYRLKLKVKWGKTRWVPRTDKLRDSGICYHSIGPAGIDYWRSWMTSQEFQIMEGHMGDYWRIGNTAVDIRAFSPEGSMNAVANESQPFLSFGAMPSVSGFCLRSENHESQPGEWTDLELICFEGRSLHIVNGHVVMVLKNSRVMQDGTPTPLNKGKIQLQSEATEVFFTDIKIQPIDALPVEYVQLFQ